MGRKNNADRGLYCRMLPSGREVWYIRFSWNGQDIRKAGGKTKEQARRLLRATLTDLQRGAITLKPHQSATLAAAIERYRPLAERKRNYSKSQCFFTFWNDRLGKEPLSRITPGTIERIQTALLGEKKSPATVNRYTDWLRHVLYREIRLGHLSSNPVAKVARLTEPDAPIHQYSLDQEQRLMQILGTQGSWLRLAILTGLRQAEQFSIKKEWIDWEAGYIQIPTSKANRPRIVVMTGEIRAIVRDLCLQSKESPYLFPSPRNPTTPRNPHYWYKRIFKPACAKAGIPSGLKWHTLRHTGGSRLAALGANTHQIKAWGGWTTDLAANRYIHLVSADLVQVAELLSLPPNTAKIGNSEISSGTHSGTPKITTITH